MHRAIYESIDCFLDILLEYYGRNLSLWLAPNQVNIIPVNNKIHLNQVNIIRNAQIKKVPYTIVIDNDEVSNNTLSVRKYGEHEGQIYNVNEFIAIVMNENNILN
ncbi:His/Gly/Thr/Pro-type tRNA ligase C-terminal domain-containing protein [Staphylococcus equorum]|uniref:His/Gly/Thr/Pro-type tRNA ligase C-terminal domain-containing protein n=1 Tax=Staphylococcus equorum TaxID=246432 RepID=UPI000E0EC3D0|nr:His/Gly/Thr/Pro-type tRNA ligase C-terminal domain-containing protein [Staphylococcus equorum]QQT24162.1 hypothetical protein I6J06_12200 [Staphylococcus equorum]RTX78700.1 hypothetical protein CD125_05650 [Staphylococcus equorum subsp. equorum]